jgi:hypothetical protein
MACFSGPEILNDGLVFCYDQGNTDKSWKGAPTTNLITNPLPNGTTTGFAAIGGVGTLTYDAQTEAIKWVRTSYEVWGAYHTITPIFNGTLSTSVQYSISFEWKVENNVFSNNVYVYELVQGNAVSPAGTANLVANSTLQPNGWFLFKYTFTPANAGVGDAYNRIYFPSQSANTSTFYWRKIQFEQNALATPFVNGTRSNTQALLDMTGQNTITANSLTYASNNTFSFDGGANNAIDCGGASAIKPTAAITVSTWIKFDGGAGNNRILSDWHQDSLVDRWIFYTPDSTSVVWYMTSNGQVEGGTPGYSFSIGQWVNLTGTYNQSQQILYVNGVQHSSISRTGTLKAGNSSQTVRIGRQANTGLSHNGSISSVQIYNRALTATEVAQNFEATRGRYGI